MQIAKYIPSEYPKNYEDFKHTLSIGEMDKSPEMSMHMNAEIIKIINKWSKVNPKAKNLCETETQILIVEHLTENCSNLELQEVNYIFKQGIKGAYGIIYNDITIDAVCGKGGWIEAYYKESRHKRKEPEPMKIDPKFIELQGTEISLEEFLERNPEFKDKLKLATILDKCKNSTLKLDDVKEFYKIKGLTLNDFKDDCEVYSYNYFTFQQGKGFKEMQYILEEFRVWIIRNIYFSKKDKQ